MSYVFKGKLCGFFCNDCSEPLDRVKVRLYRPSRSESVTILAVADANQTFHQVHADELKAKQKLLIAETTTDASGAFTFELGEKEKYSGEAFEIDFVCGNNYHKPVPPRKFEEFQFHITTLQPQWREKGTDNQAVNYFGWEYCIAAKWWCLILRILDLWVICGRVVDCETGKAVEGVRVFAFDVDLLQDDPLGSAYTDVNGHFKITYTSADFSKTIFSWLNVEWPAGPDIYFRVETPSGLVLLKEDRQTGHRADRTNAHNCFCVKLCVKSVPVDVPWFTHVGNYNITSDIDGSGLTTHDRSFAGDTGYGFFSAIKLVGYATKKVPTAPSMPLYYRFVYSVDGSPWAPVTEANIYLRIKVGVRQITWGGITAFQDIVIDKNQPASAADSIPADNAPNPIPDHVLRLDANGWVRVDQVGLDNGFYGPLLWIDSNTIVPGGDPKVAADTAGNIPAVPKNGKKVSFAFQTTDDPSNPASSNFREQSIQALIHINNWNEHSMLTLEELTTGGGSGCNPITTNAHVHYTADHELMAAWGLGVSSAAIPSGITITNASGPTLILPRGKADTIDFANPGTVNPAFNTWPSCAYRLALTTRRKLTDGEYNDVAKDYPVILFCR